MRVFWFLIIPVNLATYACALYTLYPLGSAWGWVSLALAILGTYSLWGMRSPRKDTVPPSVPPKTELEQAREMLAEVYTANNMQATADYILQGGWDNLPIMDAARHTVRIKAGGSA